MHTDEYEISISREIVVCRNQIERVEKAISELVQRHKWLEGFSTTDGHLDLKQKAVLDQWIELHEGLQAWRQRLKEYEEAYSAIRSRKAWPNAI
ncbi:MAG: hypothetical protein ABWK15_05810 [Dissulfuribacterales bacterium]